MAFGNPIVAGDQLVRNRIRTPNYQKGIAGWAINEDGSAEFNNLSTNGIAQGPSAVYDNVAANKTLSYKGTELQTILDGKPSGYEFEGFTQSAAVAVGASAVEVTEVAFVQQAGRVYNVYFNGMHFYLQGQGRLLTFLTVTTDGTDPTPSSNCVDSTFDLALASGLVYTSKPLKADGVWGPAGNTIRVRLWAASIDNIAGNYYSGTGNYTKPLRITVEDAGIQRSTGWNAVAAPPKVRYDQTWNSTAVQTYQSNGQKSVATNNNAWAYQGDGSAVGNPGGNQYGCFFFDSASIRSALSGANIVATYIYLHNLHSYYNSGVQAVIGMHNGDPVPGTLPGGTVLGELLEQVAEGGSFWTGDVTSWLGTALQNGSARGVVMGAAGSADIAHYGYFDACSVRIVYEK